jgi:hypothetical protein
MTDPEKAVHDQDPWEPSVDPSQGPEVTAGQDYTDVYGGTVAGPDNGPTTRLPNLDKNPDDPDQLFAAYTAAPDVVPGPRPSSSGSGPSVAASAAFKVAIAEVRGLESSLLGATSTMIDSYTDLRNQVISASHSSTFFGQKDLYQQDMTTFTSSEQSDGDNVQTKKDDLDSMGQDFAQSIIPAMTQLMSSVAASIEFLGTFNASLNNAAQMYAQSDSNSAFPEGGGAIGNGHGTHSSSLNGDPLTKSSPGTPSPSHKSG